MASRQLEFYFVFSERPWYLYRDRERTAAALAKIKVTEKLVKIEPMVVQTKKHLSLIEKMKAAALASIGKLVGYSMGCKVEDQPCSICGEKGCQHLVVKK